MPGDEGLEAVASVGLCNRSMEVVCAGQARNARGRAQRHSGPGEPITASESFGPPPRRPAGTTEFSTATPLLAAGASNYANLDPTTLALARHVFIRPSTPDTNRSSPRLFLSSLIEAGRASHPKISVQSLCKIQSPGRQPGPHLQIVHRQWRQQVGFAWRGTPVRGRAVRGPVVSRDGDARSHQRGKPWRMRSDTRIAIEKGESVQWLTLARLADLRQKLREISG
jgi:hypothetical protein